MLAPKNSVTRWLSLLARALSVTGTVQDVEQDGGQNSEAALDAIESQFVGNYELVKYQTFRRDGEAVDLDYLGRIMYDEAGNMAAQGMPRDLPTRSRQRGQSPRGGFAYFGRFSVDLEKSIVVHHVVGSPTTVRWVGGDNVRYFEFSDGLLHLSLKDGSGRVTGTLSWRKLQN